MNKHTILFLAANPSKSDRLALDREARAIQKELESAGYRDRFELETRWAAEPLDLLRELRKLKPTVVHFSGHGGQDTASEPQPSQVLHPNAVGELSLGSDGQQRGLFFHGTDGSAQIVSTAALAETFGAAGSSVKLVVLSACYSEVHAEALLAHVDCVVGMSGSVDDDAARSFAIGFYGGLGERESVAAAYKQGCAAISLEGLRASDRPQLKVRAGVDVSLFVLADYRSAAPAPSWTRVGLIDFTTERQRHARFVEREDVLARLDDWLLGPGESSWVVVIGGPGMGKSAILSAWLARREAAGAVVPHHFVRRQVADWDEPEVIGVSLAAQIEAAYPALCDPDAKPERRLLELLGRVSKQLSPSQGLVVVVDGLDETRTKPGDNPLPRFLPHVLPAGIRFLCATRPTYPHLSWIEARSSVRSLDLDHRRWGASNEAVVRGFWEAIGAELRPPLDMATMAVAIARADGNVLHAIMLHDALHDLPASERRADRIPRGLKGLIYEIWDHTASHSAVRRGLGLLCAAQEALSLDVLAELAGWNYDEKIRFLRDARQLLLEEPASWAGVEAYRLRHDWVRELIAERLGAATIRAHHKTLSQTLATWPPPADATRRSYAVRHALAHRLAIHDWSGVHELASDLGYLEARAYTADVFVLEQDLKNAAAKCPDPPVVRDLAELARALARESHWVRDDPMGTAGLIWNRLRRWGWTAEELQSRIRLPAGAMCLRVRHAASRESDVLERTLDGHTGWVRACAVTADGSRVVSASDDHTLRVWDLDAGRTLVTLEHHASEVRACAVTPDGRHVVSASNDGTLKIWDLDTGRVLATLDGHTAAVTACAVTPDGRRVVSASWDRTLKIWDLDTGRALATLGGHAFGVTACAVTPDGRRVISASIDRTLKIWDLDTGDIVATLDGHAAGVCGCAVTPDGRHVISASTDRTLKVWDLHTGHLLVTHNDHPSEVAACLVTPDGRYVVSASDQTLTIWDLSRILKFWKFGIDCTLARFDGHARRVTACAMTPDGRRVVSASEDCTLKVWDLAVGRVVAAVNGHEDRVNACAMTPDGQRVVSASTDGTLNVWDVNTGRVLVTFDDHNDCVTACAVTPDGQRVVSVSADRKLRIWDLATGQRFIPEPHKAFSGVGMAWVIAQENRSIRFADSWARREGASRVLATLEDQTAWIHACVMMPDGRRLISASKGGALNVWDLATGGVAGILDGHPEGVTACAVTPDGRRLVSAFKNGQLVVWDLDANRVLATLDGHDEWVRACVVTPDGRHMVSASTDCTLKIWDLVTGHILATLDGHTDRVTACAVTPNSQHVISTSDDRTLKVWDLASARCLLTHRGDAPFQCVTTTADVIVAGDSIGTVWFLEWPHEFASLHLRSQRA
jgi:WD40 repeat protein